MPFFFNLLSSLKHISVKFFRKTVCVVRRIVGGIRFGCHFLCSKWIFLLLFSLLTSLLTCAVGYCLENQQSNLKEATWVFHFLDRLFKEKPVSQTDTAFFINVSFDRQLVPVDPKKPWQGSYVITDRQKLLRFLHRIERDSVEYKYILMDIRFEKGYETEYDDSLYAQIHRMPRIVIASHHKSDSGEEYEIADTILSDKCGMSDYTQYSIVTNFSRYTFLQDGKPSIALKMYDELRHKTTSVKQWRNWPVYYTDGHLCINSPMLYMSGKVLDFESYMLLQEDAEMERLHDGLETGMEAEAAKLDSEQNNYYFYHNLGADFLNPYNNDWRSDLKNRVVVIANFEDDIHDTYVGKVSGAYITWMAYQYLCDGRHVLGWKFPLLSFLCYTSIFLLLFYVNKVSQKKDYVNKPVCQSWFSALRWLGSIGLLYLLTLLLYNFMKIRFNMTVPVLAIAVINFIIQSAGKYENNNTITQ